MPQKVLKIAPSEIESDIILLMIYNPPMVLYIQYIIIIIIIIIIKYGSIGIGGKSYGFREISRFKNQPCNRLYPWNALVRL